ncbi:AAA-like domain-containing protein, partial [Armatimonas sp.]|uniref:AAA-like domain-containing protein n=1 Tax=Armatimonas sp. TaxID=1872638 RepID=UPI003752E496
AASYVTRNADATLLTSLLVGEFCYVLNTRQMGKSSLSVRTIVALQEKGVKTVFLDLTRFGGQNVTAEQWYLGLLVETGRALGLRAEFLAYWKAHAEFSFVQRFFGALGEVALEKLTDSIVIFVDELDAALSLPFLVDEFFGALRESFNRRTQDERFQRLTFCLLGVATPADLISDTRMSPFNIGKRITLTDFMTSEAAPLASHLTGGKPVLDRVLHWTGGHPYLTQRLCRAIAEEPHEVKPADVDRLCEALFLSKSARDSDDNLSFVRNRLLRSEVDLASLLDLYGKVRSGKRVPDDETNPLVPVLRLSGVARVDASGHLIVRNRIYDHVFDKHWILSHMPDAELRRQKEAYRRGTLRTGFLAGAVIAVIGLLALNASQNAKKARLDANRAKRAEIAAKESTEEARHNLYIANMNVIQADYEKNNFSRINKLLEETKDSPYRGFEWGYWNRLCNQNRLTLKGHTGPVNSAVYSPDGKYVVTGGMDKTAKVWDAATGKELLSLHGHSDRVYGVAFSPKGERIATASVDGTAKVWDSRTGRELFTLKGHTGPVYCVTFSPDGKRLVTGGTDEKQKWWDGQLRVPALNIRIWDSGTGQQTLAIRHDVPIESVEFSPDGKRILVS